MSWPSCSTSGPIISSPTPEPEPDGGAELRAAHRRIIEAGDGARRRLARDIHDGVQQHLVAAVIRLQLAQDAFETDPAKAKAMLDSGVLRAEEGLQTLRDLVAGIHPPVLTHLGLAAAVDALGSTSPVHVRLDSTVGRLPSALEASLYFFVSEALTNAVKHAQAAEVVVRLSSADGRLVLEVQDDGIGGVPVTEWGSGLQGLADRIDALHGTFDVMSAAGGGTTLRADMPVPAQIAG